MKITGTCPVSKLSTNMVRIRMILRDKSKLIKKYQDEKRGR